MKDPDVGGYHLWAAADPGERGSVDGAVGFVLAAQGLYDLQVIRQLLEKALRG
jgi:hypothetical protein